MNKKVLISEPKRKLFQLLLEDHRVSTIVMTNGEIPESIQVHTDGSVTFGRTPRNWWNILFRDKETKDFETVCIRMAKAFAKYLPPNSNLARFLTEEIIKNAIEEENYELVIDKFVMYAFLGVTDGDYKLNKLKLFDEGTEQQQKNSSGRSKIRCQGTAYLDLGGGQIPLGVFIEE